MKITPIEIRQKTFEKGFRGYEKDEVNAFLLSMSQEWEKLVDENKEYKIKLDMTEKEVKKLKEVENSLYKTLKTAEDTGTHLIEQASKSADLRLVEAQQKSEIMLTDAQNRAKRIVIEADKKAKQALEEALNELKALERDFRTMENLRDNMFNGVEKAWQRTPWKGWAEWMRKMPTSLSIIESGEFKDLLDKRMEHHLEEPISLGTFTPQEEVKPAFIPEETVKLTPVAEVPEPVVPVEEVHSEVVEETPALAIQDSPAVPDTTPQPAPVEEKRRPGSFFDELEAS